MTPLVLLPGMMCDARLYAPQIAALGGARALHLAPIGGHPSIEALAAEVLAHAPPRFALAGLSMGAVVAMEVVAQAPDRVERLALLDASPLDEPPERQALRDRQIAQVRAGGLREVIRDEMKPNYLAEGPDRTEILDLCLDMALDLGPEVFERQSLALRDRHDRRPGLRDIRVPTLLLCGRHDRLCPVERHEMMQGLIPGARLEVIEHAGHLPVLERPLETTAALRRWLEA